MNRSSSTVQWAPTRAYYTVLTTAPSPLLFRSCYPWSSLLFSFRGFASYGEGSSSHFTGTSQNGNRHLGFTTRSCREHRDEEVIMKSTMRNEKNDKERDGETVRRDVGQQHHTHQLYRDADIVTGERHTSLRSPFTEGSQPGSQHLHSQESVSRKGPFSFPPSGREVNAEEGTAAEEGHSMNDRKVRTRTVIEEETTRKKTGKEWWTQWWNAGEEQWAQRKIGLTAMAVGAGFIWYCSSATYTLTNDPSPYKNTMFHHFPCDYAIIENRWTGYRHVISLEEGEEEKRKKEDPEEKNRKRWWEEHGDEGKPISITTEQRKENKKLNFPSTPDTGLSLSRIPQAQAVRTEGPGVSVCRHGAVITRKISINRLKNRIYCYLQKKASVVVLPLEEVWFPGTVGLAKARRTPRVVSAEEGAPLHAPPLSSHDRHQQESEPWTDAQGAAAPSAPSAPTLVCSPLGVSAQETIASMRNGTPERPNTRKKETERKYTSSAAVASVGAPSPALYFPVSEGVLIVNSVVRPLKTKNGYQKGQLSRYELTLQSVSKDVLRQRYHQYLQQQVGVDGEPSCVPYPSLSSMSGQMETTLAPTATRAPLSGAHRVVVEELLRQEGRIPRGKRGGDEVPLGVLIPDLQRFTLEVREKAKKRLGRDVIIYDFSIHIQKGSSVSSSCLPSGVAS